MIHFAFSYGLDLEESAGLEASCKAVWGPIATRTIGEFSLHIPSELGGKLVVANHHIGAVAGYCYIPGSSNDSSETSEARLIDAILHRKEWPLEKDWSGTFCGVAFSNLDKNLVLFNDLIGYFPLYYSTSSRSVWGSTSLITLARFRGAGVDLTGISQAISSEGCNYGRRTLLTNVQRLLSGELIRFASTASSGNSTFDNTLYNGNMNGKLQDVARTVWDLFKDEVGRAVEGRDSVSLALSGGWDSRLLLGALKEKTHSIHCYTYGDCSGYENQIAMRCAKVVGAEHRCLSLVGNYIPHRNQLEPFVKATEQTGYHYFLPFLEMGRNMRSVSALLQGDTTESIDGRNMGGPASRASRKKSFLRGFLGIRDDLENLTPEGMAKWRNQITKEKLESVLQALSFISPELINEGSCAKVQEETAEDLKVLFERVSAHHLTYLPTAHELFRWHSFVRNRATSQSLFLNAQWNSLCPPMSMRFLRMISTVHPSYRLRRRLMNTIARLPDLKGFSSIPSAQIPWVGATAPDLFKDLIWGFRSEVDQKLIQRAVRSRNPTMRRRVLRTFDLVAEYRSPQAIDNVASWFSGRWLKGDEMVQIARNRASLVSWPLVTIDIGFVANVSMLLDLCFPKS